jgi:hypothetical protein
MINRATSIIVAVLTLLAGTAGLLASSAAPAGAVIACTTSWKAPGTSGAFETAGNWTAGIPTSTVDACLPASATPYVVSLTSTRSARGIVVGSGATVRVLTTAASGNVSLGIGVGCLQNDGTVEFGAGDGTPLTAYLWAPGGSVDNRGTFHVLPSVYGTFFGVVASSFHNADGATFQADAKTEVMSLTNDGSLVATGRVTVDTLTNYDATTRTLHGGQYDVENLLSLPGPIATLDANVFVAGGAGIQDRSGAAGPYGALGVLSTVTANGELGLGEHGSLTTPALTNHGRVSVANQAAFFVQGTYTQDGVYTSLSTGGFVQTNGSFLLKSGYLVGGGEVLGDGVVNSGGVVAPAPRLTIAGNYTQQAGGTFQSRFGGAQGAYVLQVGGQASLAGTLDATANPDANLQIGNTFALLNSGNRTGAFTTLATHGVTAPLALEAKPAAFGVSVAVVANYDDNDALVGYQAWRAITGNGGSGNSFHYDRGANETASFTFTGTSVTWNTAKTTESGKAQVLIDGVSKGTFDLYAATNAMYPVTFSGLTTGKHTIVVKVLGTKNAASSNTNVVVDGFTVGTTLSDDTGHAISWGPWKGAAGFGLAWYSSSTAGAVASVTTPVVNSIDWVTSTGPGFGRAQVFLGTTLVKTVDLYSATTTSNVHVNVPVTAAGTQVLTVKVLGTKNAASTGTTVNVDAFVAR